MDKILDKISAYNIFTNLFPGVIYCFLTEKIFEIKLIQEDLVVSLFVYYFAGMVISRVSSVVIEPLLELTRFITFADYKHYIAASKEDQKIGELLETSNSYRSVVSLLLCLLATGGWNEVVTSFPCISNYSGYLLITSLSVLFLFAYRKQTQYIVVRVDNHQKKESSSQ